MEHKKNCTEHIEKDKWVGVSVCVVCRVSCVRFSLVFSELLMSSQCILSKLEIKIKRMKWHSLCHTHTSTTYQITHNECKCLPFCVFCCWVFCCLLLFTEVLYCVLIISFRFYSKCVQCVCLYDDNNIFLNYHKYIFILLNLYRIEDLYAKVSGHVYCISSYSYACNVRWMLSSIYAAIRRAYEHSQAPDHSCVCVCLLWEILDNQNIMCIYILHVKCLKCLIALNINPNRLKTYPQITFIEWHTLA